MATDSLFQSNCKRQPAEHGITSEIELIKIDQINEAYERMLKSDVKDRFVIGMASLG